MSSSSSMSQPNNLAARRIAWMRFWERILADATQPLIAESACDPSTSPDDTCDCRPKNALDQSADEHL